MSSRERERWLGVGRADGDDPAGAGSRAAAEALRGDDPRFLMVFAPLDSTPPRGLIAFDCIARRRILGEEIGAEVDRISAHGGGAPVAGFYTYGEIARTRGISGFHNQTLVVLAVG